MTAPPNTQAEPLLSREELDLLSVLFPQYSEIAKADVAQQLLQTALALQARADKAEEELVAERLARDEWKFTADTVTDAFLEVSKERDGMREALKLTVCELSHCASQLAHKGMKGHPGDSVSRALEAGRALLGPKAVTPSITDTGDTLGTRSCAEEGSKGFAG